MNPICPRFHNCNASVCPLIPVWGRAVHLPGEPICFYLRATGKSGANEQFRDDPAFAACHKELPDVAARHPDIRRKVQRASRCGFRGEHLKQSADSQQKLDSGVP